MAYVKKDWQDLPSQTTPVTADDLDRIENGIEYNDKRLNGTIPAGEMIVDSIRSKNVFDKNLFVKDVGTRYNVLPTGVRIILNVSAQYMWGVFKLPDDLLGKTITISSTITPSASNNGKVGLAFGDSSNDPVGNFITELTQTGNVTATIPSSFPSGANKIILLIYGNVNGTGATNDYVDYTNLQVEEGTTTTTYTPYQELNPDNFKNKEIVVGSIRSKNLFNSYRQAGSYGTATYTVDSDGKITQDTSDDALWSNAIGRSFTLPAGTYTFNIIEKNPDNTFQVYNYNTSSSIHESTNADFTVTFNETTRLGLKTYGSNYPNSYYIQIEEGSVVTLYSPYQNLDGMENYSTGETVIGTFLGKPLYRKVIEFTVNDTSQILIPHNISNLSWVTKCDTSIYNQYGYYMASSKDIIDVNFDSNYIYFTSSWPTGSAKIIMEYTKN